MPSSVWLGMTGCRYGASNGAVSSCKILDIYLGIIPMVDRSALVEFLKGKCSNHFWRPAPSCGQYGQLHQMDLWCYLHYNHDYGTVSSWSLILVYIDWTSCCFILMPGEIKSLQTFHVCVCLPALISQPKTSNLEISCGKRDLIIWVTSVNI